ncbi:hypothetical protein BKA82DRAFT_182748 [Pisolithus tinctorius]|uniref:Uncharacterized protein n=1 Tax=Pisolithus tinctorius Marx 270 TaxID=870435 RepID=A0A0C3JZY4_PISTI|nr:hypothetical protein BKA82DRAFT_182748 [Pisolithus tinctorius]KIO14713.1 hypothetical protein M404DRAFT_182748 [Pisolithus tinctorius Marx 270]
MDEASPQRDCSPALRFFPPPLSPRTCAVTTQQAWHVCTSFTYPSLTFRSGYFCCQYLIPVSYACTMKNCYYIEVSYACRLLFMILLLMIIRTCILGIEGEIRRKGSNPTRRATHIKPSVL